MSISATENDSSAKALSKEDLQARRERRTALARILWRQDLGDNVPADKAERESLFQQTRDQYFDRASRLDKALEGRGYTIVKN